MRQDADSCNGTGLPLSAFKRRPCAEGELLERASAPLNDLS
jgi:hypothetical protein